MEGARYLIVDAHSMIFAWDDLRALHSRNRAAARDELVRRLTAYQDASGERVVVVFDGGSEKRASRGHKDPDGIQVLYSAKGQTADAVIERLALKYAKTYRLTVATNDIAERNAIFANGAEWVGAETLARMLEREDAEIQRRIEKLRRR
ncbi:MAG: NYN domain-containing protein [Verrucomicrobiales bacterium]